MPVLIHVLEPRNHEARVITHDMGIVGDCNSAMHLTESGLYTILRQLDRVLVDLLSWFRMHAVHCHVHAETLSIEL